MGRPITVNLGADIRDYLKKMRDAVTGTQNAARDVQRAGQQMGQGLTAGPARGFAGFSQGLRGIGPAAAGAGKDGANQFSQVFAQGLITSGGNAPQAFLSALGAALPAFGAVGFGIAIGAQLINGYLQQLDKAKQQVTEAGRLIIRAQTAGMLEEADAQQVLINLTGEADFTAALQAINKAADEAKVPVEDLVSALVTGGTDASALRRQIIGANQGGLGAVKLLEKSVQARSRGVAANRAMEGYERGIARAQGETAASAVRSAEAKERYAAAARGVVLPMTQAEAAAARQYDAIHENRRAMRELRMLAADFAGYLEDGKISSQEYTKIQAFDGENLAQALDVINRFESLENRRIALDIITSYEDDRRLNIVASLTGNG